MGRLRDMGILYEAIREMGEMGEKDSISINDILPEVAPIPEVEISNLITALHKRVSEYESKPKLVDPDELHGTIKVINKKLKDTTNLDPTVILALRGLLDRIKELNLD